MTREKSQNAIFILNRLKNSLSIDSDIKLAAYLGVKANTISSWKSRDSLDYQLIIAKCEENNIDLNFIFLNKNQNIEEANTNKNEDLALLIAKKNKETIEEMRCEIEAFKTLLKIDEQLRD